MAVLMNANGEYVDTTTGDVVGLAEGTPTAVDPRSAAGVDTNPPQTALGTLGGVLQQLSWGFNAGLFALPDAGVQAIGAGLDGLAGLVGLRYDTEKMKTLTKIFNAGEHPGRDSAERYARAIGEGVGAGMPLTGLVAGVARFTPMVKPALAAGEGTLKNIARETINFAQKNPKLAVGMDVAFNAGYEGLRQAVEENVDDSDPNKALYKELLPAGAFIGLPLAVSLSPTIAAGKFASKKWQSFSAGLPEVEAEVAQELSPFWKLPGVKIFPKLLMRNAERKLEKVFGPINESPEAQKALQMLKDALDDPRIADAGFQFDVAEESLYAPLLAEKKALLEGMGPKDIAAHYKRVNENQRKLGELFDQMAPDADTTVRDAFLGLQQERNDFFQSILSQKQQLTDAELERLSQAYGPMDMDMINDELRGIIYAGMEMDNQMRQKILSRMGMKQATAPDGTPLPTREEGKSIFPAVDMEEAASKLIEKYTPERPSMRRYVPEPIQQLQRFVESQQIQRTKLEKQMVNQLLDQTLTQQLGDMGLNLAPDMQGALRSAMRVAVEGPAKKGGRRGVSLGDIASAKDADGFLSIPSGIPGKNIRFNPDQIMADAQRIAMDNTAININLPEGLDYLESAMRFRNDSLMRYNNALKRGRSRLTDAQRHLDTGEAVLKDMEDLILGHVPRINRDYTNLKMVVDDYRKVYEQSLPLLMTERAPRGGADAFMLPNEKVMQNAFKTADGVRQLTTMLSGPTAADQRGMQLLEQGAFDWLRGKKIFDGNGMIDPNKIASVLDQNRNIINALPDSIQTKLMSEFDTANDIVTRLGVLDQRRIAAENADLDKLIKEAVRPDADTAQSLAKAIKDPAAMRTLVSAFEKDPARLAALRRSVFDIASGGSAQGGALQSFLDTNAKSLNVLFKPEHLTDLRRLADLQRRVNAFADVSGQIPEFESLDQTLKSMFGSGIQYMTTTLREAAVGRIRPETGVMALMIRLVANTENQIYNRIFTKALEDPAFAKRMVNTKTPAQAKVLMADLQQIGISVPKLMQTVTAAKQESAQALMDKYAPVEERQNKPTMSQSMLRKLPPAPKLGFDQIFNPAAPTTGQAQGGGQPSMLYPQLFPKDPISDMLKQRAAGQMMPGQPQQ